MSGSKGLGDQAEMTCESNGHKWVFQGTVYWSDKYPIPGSGAHERIYADRYFCEKCLECLLRNERYMGNDYYPPIAGTLPR